MSHENEEKLKRSIARLGMFKPVIVREMEGGVYQCLGGAHRVEQAIAAGLQTVPVVNLGVIPDDKAQEISLIDNARYGVDDTLRLAELIKSLDEDQIIDIMPWSEADIHSIVESLSVDIDDLDIDVDPAQGSDPDEEPKQRPAKTHEILRFKCSLNDAALVRERIGQVLREQGFTSSDELTNAGDALVHILSAEVDDATDD